MLEHKTAHCEPDAKTLIVIINSDIVIMMYANYNKCTTQKHITNAQVAVPNLNLISSVALENWDLKAAKIQQTSTH